MAEGFLPKLGRIQHALRRDKLTGWLLADSGRNRVARLLLSSRGSPRRRYVFWVPAEGFPITLAHRLDASEVARFPGESWEYDGWAHFRSQLGRLLPREGRIAVEYSPMGSHPFLDQQGAGFVELLRSYGVFLVSSGDLLSEFLGPLTDKEKAAHRQVHQSLRDVVGAVIGELHEERGSAEETSSRFGSLLKATAASYDLKLQRMELNLTRDADLGEFLQAFVRVDGLGSAAEWSDTLPLQADGAPAQVKATYQVLRESLEVVNAFVSSRLEQRRHIVAFELDQLVRNHFIHSGHGDTMDHRLGHALGALAPLGEVGLLDSYETMDTRTLHANTAWALHPSLKCDNVRVQLSAAFLLEKDGLEWTSLPPESMAGS